LLSLDISEFLPLQGFPLLWRWNQPTRGAFTQHELALLTPLTAAAARRVADFAKDLYEGNGLSTRLLDSIIDCDASSAPVARKWLSARPVLPRVQVVVSWDPSTAIALPWDLFVHRWDDFCYPTSDDLTTLPLGGGWVLAYSHEEVFQWGRERAV
jgi:hypothetical protein